MEEQTGSATYKQTTCILYKYTCILACMVLKKPVFLLYQHMTNKRILCSLSKSYPTIIITYFSPCLLASCWTSYRFTLTHLYIIYTVIPAPLNLIITSTMENSISLIWEKPPLLNEMIIYYEVS